MGKFIGAFLILVSSASFCQQQDYFVLFKDKSNSNFSVTRPAEFLAERSIVRRNSQKIEITEQDLPVSSAYISQVNALSKVRYSSKWLNGVLIRTDQATLNKITALSFVSGILWNGDLKKAASVDMRSVYSKRSKFEDAGPLDFGLSDIQNTMIGVDKMHEAGYMGQGVLIGIFDSGFSNAQNLALFTNLFAGNQIKATWDFVADETNVYNDHSHGTNVLSVIAADRPGQFIGTAPKADFALFRTEDVASETRIEELYWLLAAERADSLGVDVINSSLGYYSFDNPIQNYQLSQLDGNTALITKAADWLASKGVLVVTSAGNEGRNSWGKITFPADADSVLAVAAVSANEEYVAFSSIGPSANGRVKPELAAMGLSTTVGSTNNTIGTSNGTSFSSPLIAGLAAGIKQAFPDLTAMEIRDILIKSGSQSDNPDEFLGYGIPDFERASEIAAFEQMLKDSGETLFIYPNPVSNEFALKGVITDDTFTLPYSIQLFDAMGRKIYERLSENLRFSIFDQLEKLPSGNYFIRVQDEEKSVSKRFIKK